MPGFGMDFRGWNSSYTGDPIPLEEMVEWRSATVDRIMALQPRRVLEIGAGSGLLLVPDRPALSNAMSPPICRRWRSRTWPLAGAAADPWRDRVELLTQPAHVTEALPQGYFDTIILNSVVQYFPNAGYLAEVIDSAMDLLAPGGAVFIGDVRNHSLQGAFQTAVALARTAAADHRHRRDPPTGPARYARRTRIAAGPRVFHHLGRRPSVGGRTRHRSQTRIGRQRTQPVSLRRHHPQDPRTGTLAGQRTHLGVGPMRGPARAAHPVDIPTSRHACASPASRAPD